MKDRFKNGSFAVTDVSQLERRDAMTEPIAQNSRKTPSQFQNYPPKMGEVLSPQLPNKSGL